MLRTITTFLQALFTNVKEFFGFPITKKKVLITAIILLVVFLFLRGGETSPETTEGPTLPAVVVGTADSLNGSVTVDLYGTVAAVTQASLQAETGGRVVAVPVSLGQAVRPGAVIAQIENAAERASVLQAQGAYEAALAAAAQGEVGVRDAENAVASARTAAVTTLSTSYNTVSGVTRTAIDTYFSGPDTANPGLRINGYGATQQINASRVALSTALTSWNQLVTNTTVSSDLPRALTTARTHTNSALAVVDGLLNALGREQSSLSVDQERVRAQTTELTSVRGTLLGIDNSLAAAQTQITNATDNLDRAKLQASRPNTPSAADAQIKQALGALAAAQANLAKTIIRSPIAGTVNSLQVRAGDFIAPNTPVATIANNNGIEVTTFVGERDVVRFAVGTPVLVRDTIAASVSNVSPAIDPATGKTEIRIGVEDNTLKPGDTVRVSLGTTTVATTTPSPIRLPLAAVKFEGTSSYVFVVENDTLTRRDVVVGDVVADRIEIASGIDRTTEIVLDARGKSTGEKVTVVRN